MKVKKVEDVDFSVRLLDGDVNVQLKWKEGQLYLALSGVLVGAGDKLYEIPLRDLEGIEVIDREDAILYVDEYSSCPLLLYLIYLFL